MFILLILISPSPISDEITELTHHVGTIHIVLHLPHVRQYGVACDDQQFTWLNANKNLPIYHNRCLFIVHKDSIVAIEERP